MLKNDDDDIREPTFFSLNDPNLVGNFLHVTDLRLYKIVKWARNLPCFTSTLQEDQILLLQNAWCDLLLLDICNKTMTSVIKSSHGRCILLTKNHQIDGQLGEYLQLNDLISQLYDLMSMIETTQMDNNEFVALKVLILLSPGIFMHKGEMIIEQKKVIDHFYYFCCVLLKIQEDLRMSFESKELRRMSSMPCTPTRALTTKSKRANTARFWHCALT